MASKVLTTNSGSDNPNVVLADGQVLPCTLQAPVTAAAEQWGFDAFVASSTFLPLGGDPAYIPRDAASPANPMQVTFPSWTSGDTLGVWWNLTLIVNNGLTFPSLFRAYAAVSLDGGATFQTSPLRLTTSNVAPPTSILPVPRALSSSVRPTRATAARPPGPT
jgi:hypothetical protein